MWEVGNKSRNYRQIIYIIDIYTIYNWFLTGRYPCGWLNIPADEYEYSAVTFSVQDIQRSPDVPFFHLRCAKMSMVKLCEATIYHNHLLVLFGPTHIQTGPEGVGCLSPPGSLLQTSAEVFCFPGPCASGSGWAAHPVRTRVSRKETKEPPDLWSCKFFAGNRCMLGTLSSEPPSLFQYGSYGFAWTWDVYPLHGSRWPVSWGTWELSTVNSRFAQPSGDSFCRLHVCDMAAETATANGRLNGSCLELAGIPMQIDCSGDQGCMCKSFEFRLGCSSPLVQISEYVLFK